MTAAQLSFVFLALLAASTISFAAAAAAAAGEEEEDRQRPIIATHDARFQCDEVTACFLLKQLDRFKNHKIIRTRDPEKLALAEVVVDVGGRLDFESLRFDHHQKGFNQTIHYYHPKLRTTNPTNPPLLSSAGLVYAFFGKDVIAKVLRGRSSYKELNDGDQRLVDWVFDSVYVGFIEEMDAIDNGLEAVSGEDVVYNYRIQTGIGHRVSKLNPGPLVPGAIVMQRFERAMHLVGEELILVIKHYGSVLPKGQGMREFVVKRKELDPSGQIVLVDGKKMSGHWKTAIANLESELGIEGEIKYLVYQEQNSQIWRVVAVPVDPTSFKTRVPLKEEWRGLRDEELQEVSGIRDATFVHAKGFTGGAKSLEGIKEMCLESLRAAPASSSALS